MKSEIISQHRNNPKSQIQGIGFIVCIVLISLASILRINLLNIFAVLYAIKNLRNTEILIVLYVMSALSGDFFSITSGLSLSRVIYLILLINFLYKKKSKITITILLPILIIFSCYVGFSFLRADVSYKHIIKLVQYAILTITYLFSNFQINQVKTLKYFQHAGIVLTCLFLIHIIANYQEYIVQTRLNITDDVNENRMAIIFLALALINFTLFLTNNGNIWAFVLKLFLFVSPLIVLFLIASRSAMFGLAISFSVLILKFFTDNNIRAKSKYLLYLGLILLGGLVYEYVMRLEGLVQRYSLSDIEKSGGAGRFEIWELAFEKIIPNNFLFGVGFSNTAVIAAQTRYSYTTKPAHNFIVDLLMQGGLVGASLLLVVLIYVLKQGYTKLSFREPFSILSLTLLLSIVSMGIGETIFNDKVFWAFFLLSCLKYYKNKDYGSASF